MDSYLFFFVFSYFSYSFFFMSRSLPILLLFLLPPIHPSLCLPCPWDACFRLFSLPSARLPHRSVSTLVTLPFLLFVVNFCFQAQGHSGWMRAPLFWNIRFNEKKWKKCCWVESEWPRMAAWFRGHVCGDWWHPTGWTQQWLMGFGFHEDQASCHHIKEHQLSSASMAMFFW